MSLVAALKCSGFLRVSSADEDAEAPASQRSQRSQRASPAPRRSGPQPPQPPQRRGKPTSAEKRAKRAKQWKQPHLKRHKKRNDSSEAAPNHEQRDAASQTGPPAPQAPKKKRRRRGKNKNKNRGMSSETNDGQEAMNLAEVDSSDHFNLPAADAAEFNAARDSDAQDLTSMKTHSKKQAKLDDPSAECKTKKKKKKNEDPITKQEKKMRKTKDAKDQSVGHTYENYIPLCVEEKNPTDRMVTPNSTKKNKSLISCFIESSNTEAMDHSNSAAREALSERGDSTPRSSKGHKRRHVDESLGLKCSERKEKRRKFMSEKQKMGEEIKEKNVEIKKKKRKKSSDFNSSSSFAVHREQLIETDASEGTQSEIIMDMVPTGGDREARISGPATTVTSSIAESRSKSGDQRKVQHSHSDAVTSNDTFNKPVPDDLLRESDSEPEFPEGDDAEWREHIINKYLDRTREELDLGKLHEKESSKQKKTKKMEWTSEEDEDMPLTAQVKTEDPATRNDTLHSSADTGEEASGDPAGTAEARAPSPLGGRAKGTSASFSEISDMLRAHVFKQSVAGDAYGMCAAHSTAAIDSKPPADMLSTADWDGEGPRQRVRAAAPPATQQSAGDTPPVLESQTSPGAGSGRKEPSCAPEESEPGRRPGAAGAALVPRAEATAPASTALDSDADEILTIEDSSSGEEDPPVRRCVGPGSLCAMGFGSRLCEHCVSADSGNASGLSERSAPEASLARHHSADLFSDSEEEEEPPSENRAIHPQFLLDNKTKVFAYETRITEILSKHMSKSKSKSKVDSRLEYFRMSPLIRPHFRAALLNMGPVTRQKALSEINMVLPPQGERDLALTELFATTFAGPGTTADIRMFLPGQRSCRLDMGLAWAILEAQYDEEQKKQ